VIGQPVRKGLSPSSTRHLAPGLMITSALQERLPRGVLIQTWRMSPLRKRGDPKSPELIEAILQGRQPVALTATRLTELDLPLDLAETARRLNRNSGQICPTPRAHRGRASFANGQSFREVGLHQCPSERKCEGVPV
jgi:hypothetical protein